jgi:hypothetical protein
MPGKAPKISDMKKWESSAADKKDDKAGIAKAKSRGAPPFGKGKAPPFTKGKGARMRG